MSLFKDCQKINRQQILGLCALVCISQRESTPIFYQWEEYGFGDVPLTLVKQVDELSEEQQIELVASIVSLPGSQFANLNKAIWRIPPDNKLNNP